MVLKVGDRLPGDIQLQTMPEQEDSPQDMKTGELFAGKKVVLFGVPGAFTSVCSSKHLPQFVARRDELAQRGVDTVACLAVNDAYVMREWSKANQAGEKGVLMLADGDANFTEASGLSQVLSGMGRRCLRFSLYADDGVVRVLNVEEPGPMSYKVSGPDHMLACLDDLLKGGKGEARHSEK